MSNRSFFTELRERKVLQAAAIYVAVAWGVVEIVVTVVEQLFLPQWVATLAVIGFVVGFPVAMFLAWTFDITRDGIRRTEVTSRRGTASIALSMTLLVAGTAGLFLLIKPSIHESERGAEAPDILPNSLAIMPFENVSQDEDDLYLNEGLSDELRDQLGRVAELRIAARSSSVAAVERGMDAITASDSLRVAHLVEGSVRRQGRRFRVSVQLIEGRTGLAVWSESYERGVSELLNVQQTIADEIARRVLPNARDIVTSPATRVADANELMILAHHYEQQVRSRQVVDTETQEEAVRLYRQATEADPESALAHSRLARALLYLGDIEAVEAPIRTALILDPKVAEVQNTLGEFYWARGLPQAAEAFGEALTINPNNPDALYNYAIAMWLEDGGVQSDPAQLFRRAVELDPLSSWRHAALGDFLGQNGRVAEVRPVIRNIQALFNDAESFRTIGWLYQLIGEVDRSIAWTIKARDLEPGNPDHIARLADLYSLIGDAETALGLESPPNLGVLLQLRRYPELIEAAEFRMIEEPDDIEVRYLLAFAHVATGSYQSAVRVLGSTGIHNRFGVGSMRSVADIEASMTFIDALSGSGLPDEVETAQSVARMYEEDAPWWGDIGWVATFRSCNYAILGRHEDALRWLPGVKKSTRLRYDTVLRDSWCFKAYADNPVYLDVLRDQEQRRAALRKKLPVTLEEYGVKL